MSKNLSYSAPVPSFLRKLKGEYDVDSGKQNVQIARPQKARLNLGEEGEDDGPVLVGEDGEVIGRGDGDVARALRGEDGERQDGQVVERDGTASEGVAKENREVKDARQKVTEVGAGGLGRKRKVGKVVGEEGEGDEIVNMVGKGDKVKLQSNVSDVEKSRPETVESSTTKVKKKGKKIKLSFDEPEDG